MKNFLLFFLVFLSVLTIIPSGFAKEPNVLDLVPQADKLSIKRALRVAGPSAGELKKAIQTVEGEQRAGMIFLITNMPDHDLRALTADFLLDNVRYAYQIRQELPWGKTIPNDIFLNYVLPYVSVNERRDNWRPDFYQRFLKTAQEAATLEKAVAKLNIAAFAELQVTYDAVKRPKPDQSPYESMEAHYASCTGLSILAVDIFRSVGIPARLVGIPQWTDGGNHTWVEVWDNGVWHHLGANESEKYDEAWFNDKAAKNSDANNRENRIYAASFQKTRLKFLMVWAQKIRYVSAVDVTDRYKRQTYKCPQPAKGPAGCCLIR